MTVDQYLETKVLLIDSGSNNFLKTGFLLISLSFTTEAPTPQSQCGSHLESSTDGGELLQFQKELSTDVFATRQVEK